MMKLVELRDRLLVFLTEAFYRLVLFAILVGHSLYVLVSPTKGIDSTCDTLKNWRKIA